METLTGEGAQCVLARVVEDERVDPIPMLRAAACVCSHLRQRLVGPTPNPDAADLQFRDADGSGVALHRGGCSASPDVANAMEVSTLIIKRISALEGCPGLTWDASESSR